MGNRPTFLKNDGTRYDKQSLFPDACYMGGLEKVEKLHGKKDSRRNSDKKVINRQPMGFWESPLSLASQSGSEEVSNYLLKHQAHIGQVNAKGQSVYHLCASRSRFTILALLRDHVLREAKSPVRHAKSWMMEHINLINMPDEYLMTPLMYCVAFGQLEGVLTILVGMGLVDPISECIFWLNQYETRISNCKLYSAKYYGSQNYRGILALLLRALYDSGNTQLQINGEWTMNRALLFDGRDFQTLCQDYQIDLTSVTIEYDEFSHYNYLIRPKGQTPSTKMLQVSPSSSSSSSTLSSSSSMGESWLKPCPSPNSSRSLPPMLPPTLTSSDSLSSSWDSNEYSSINYFDESQTERLAPSVSMEPFISMEPSISSKSSTNDVAPSRALPEPIHSIPSLLSSSYTLNTSMSSSPPSPETSSSSSSNILRLVPSATISSTSSTSIISSSPPSYSESLHIVPSASMSTTSSITFSSIGSLPKLTVSMVSSKSFSNAYPESSRILIPDFNKPSPAKKANLNYHTIHHVSNPSGSSNNTDGGDKKSKRKVEKQRKKKEKRKRAKKKRQDRQMVWGLKKYKTQDSTSSTITSISSISSLDGWSSSDGVTKMKGVIPLSDREDKRRIKNIKKEQKKISKMKAKKRKEDAKERKVNAVR